MNGVWMVSETRFGPLVHARLGVAEDNSGKLVTLVRNEAHNVAEQRGLPLVIVDGAPGIGCPVIASLTGADLVLLRSPSRRSRADTTSIASCRSCASSACRSPCASTRPTSTWISARGSHSEADAAGAAFVATVRLRPGVTHAQVAGIDVVTHGGRAAAEITKLWESVSADC